MRKYATTWLLIISIVIAESHSYIPEKYATVKYNWIRTVDRTMELQWNVKYVSDQVNFILYFLAMLFFIKNRVNKTTVLTFITLSIVDLGMYFHNYKTLHYGSVYIWTLGFWVLIFYSPKLSRVSIYTYSFIKCKISLLWKAIRVKIKRI
jgi:hypothetical protein